MSESFAAKWPQITGEYVPESPAFMSRRRRQSGQTHERPESHWLTVIVFSCVETMPPASRPPAICSSMRSAYVSRVRGDP